MGSRPGAGPDKLGPAMAVQRVKTYRWSEERARQRLPFDLISDERLDLPASHDQARKAVERHALARGGGQVRGCSALVGGGFAVTVG